MTKTIRILTLITAVSMMFGLFGCGKNNGSSGKGSEAKNARFDIASYRDAEENTMLLDYFDRTVGTPEEQPYDEYVLYTCSETQALLVQYAEGGTQEETVTHYRIPLDAAQEMLTAVENSGMARWNSLSDTTALDGMQYVCRFPDGKGGLERVSSDAMPENGRAAFNSVKTAMAKWARDEYLIES